MQERYAVLTQSIKQKFKYLTRLNPSLGQPMAKRFKEKGQA